MKECTFCRFAFYKIFQSDHYQYAPVEERNIQENNDFYNLRSEDHGLDQ